MNYESDREIVSINFEIMKLSIVVHGNEAKSFEQFQKRSEKFCS